LTEGEVWYSGAFNLLSRTNRRILKGGSKEAKRERRRDRKWGRLERLRKCGAALIYTGEGLETASKGPKRKGGREDFQGAEGGRDEAVSDI